MISKAVLFVLLAAAPGSTQTVAAQRFLYGTGSTLQLTAACEAPAWSTSDESVATVDDAGLVTAAGYGAVAIQAGCGGTETAFRLRVAPPLPAEISATDTVAFRNVTVVPIDSRRVLEAQTVVVRNGRIAEIGPSTEVPVPEDAYSIWADGMYLFPGLVDMHIHEVASPDWEKDLFLYLANGVTTVREMWGTPEYLRRREAIASGSVPGPRMFVASPALDGPSGRFTALTPPVATADEARRTVALDRAAGR